MKENPIEKVSFQRETIPSVIETNFENAVKYITEIVAQRKQEEPLLVVLYGQADVGKSEFSKNISSSIEGRGGKQKMFGYRIVGGSKQELERFMEFKKEWPAYRFPIVMWEHTSGSQFYIGDLHYAATFHRFPDIVAYLYDSRKEGASEHAALAEKIINERRKVSEELKVEFFTPEILSISNTRAEKKIKTGL